MNPNIYDRRAVFFLGAAVLCGLLIPVITESLRYVPTFATVTYVVLACASYLDWRTQMRDD
jgi:hypothetical protein